MLGDTSAHTQRQGRNLSFTLNFLFLSVNTLFFFFSPPFTRKKVATHFSRAHKHTRTSVGYSCITGELPCRSALLNMTLGPDNGAFLHLNLEG